MIGTFLKSAENWARGRTWYLRILLLLFLLYMFFMYLFHPDYSGIFGGLNLCIHELGHLLFSFFGTFLHVLGGTLVQLLVPLIGVAMFYRQRDFFAIGVAVYWLATNLIYISVYLGDARRLELPLVAPFGIEDVIHDWNYLLGKTGLLNYDTGIAWVVRLLGILTMLTGLVFTGWLVLIMIKTRKTGPAAE